MWLGLVLCFNCQAPAYDFVVLFLDRCPNVTPAPDPCICMFAPGAPPQCHDLGTNYECANNALCCPDGCNKGMCYY